MPSYNSSQFIRQSIDSVTNQTYKNWELIISDDNSIDNSIEIITEYIAKDNRIKLIKSGVNSGPAISRNKAIDLSQGRFIAFLDSDDLWHEQKLEKQINFMTENNVVLCYGLYETISEDGSFLSASKKLPLSIDYNGLLKNQVIGCLTAVYDTSLCGKQKMPVIRKRQDFALWLKILKQGHKAFCLNEIIGQYRLRSHSVSSNKFIAVKYTWKLYREIEHLTFFQSTKSLIGYIVQKIKRT
jgi:glycosyltransferase involved in cell wall biosynthesis